jgi:hypothetical protein
MTNLMCRGRKRGLAGVIATQRLAKLAKNVAAEASNFLMGRTFLDIDMARAADLLGMERRQAEQIRDLERGHFLALGPAISRRPLAVKIGATRTSSHATARGLLPLPDATDLQDFLRPDQVEHRPQEYQPASEPEPAPAEVLLDQITNSGEASPSSSPDTPAPDAGAEEGIAEILLELAGEEGSTFQPMAALYQDFSVRCRMRRLRNGMLDLPTFRRRFAMAVAGIAHENDEALTGVLRVARSVPDDLLAPFLIIAKAATDNAPCPDDETIARVYGTSSQGRVRRLLEYLEKCGLIVVRTDFGGRRSVGIPDIGIVTAPVEA